MVCFLILQLSVYLVFFWRSPSRYYNFYKEFREAVTIYLQLHLAQFYVEYVLLTFNFVPQLYTSKNEPQLITQQQQQQLQPLTTICTTTGGVSQNFQYQFLRRLGEDTDITGFRCQLISAVTHVTGYWNFHALLLLPDKSYCYSHNNLTARLLRYLHLEYSDS